MEWIIKIEGEQKQRIRVTFSPMRESIIFWGESKVKNNEWTVFSMFRHSMHIDLDQIQEMMAKTVVTMRMRLKEYNNVAEGFSVLKEVAFQDANEED